MTSLTGHRARKRFGQNFLIDDGVIDQIISAINPKPGDNLVEIGPGQGAITRPLLSRAGALTTVELDRDLAALLREKYRNSPGFQLIEQDALTVDFSTLAEIKPLRIVGNLPYNISTALLFHLLSFQSCVTDMHFMLQREVVERMAAAPGSRDYGRLSIMLQYHCHVAPLFEVPPGAFHPAPKVHSAIVRLIPRRDPDPKVIDEALFATVVKTCFQQRRKTLRNNLKQVAAVRDPERLPFDLGRRPESLSVAEFVSLSNEISLQNES